eukprot:jgi/Picsp_1/1707/NSC_05181-R1_---NA---
MKNKGYRTSQNLGISKCLLSRKLALEAIASENEKLKAYMTSMYTATGCLPGHSGLIAILEKQDYNLENQLARIQENVWELIKEYEDLSDQWEKSILDPKSARQGYEESLLAERKLTFLEEKKHKAVTRRSEAEHVAKTLRSSIDGLRRERKLFEELRQKKHVELKNIAEQAFHLLHQISKCLETNNKTNTMFSQVKNQLAKEEKEWTAFLQNQMAKIQAVKEIIIQRQERKARERNERLQSLLQRRKNKVRHAGHRISPHASMDSVQADMEALKSQIKELSCNIESLQQHITGKKIMDSCGSLSFHANTPCLFPMLAATSAIEIVTRFEQKRSKCITLYTTLHTKQVQDSSNLSSLQLKEVEKTFDCNDMSQHFDPRILGTPINSNPIYKRLDKLCYFTGQLCQVAMYAVYPESKRAFLHADAQI